MKNLNLKDKGRENSEKVLKGAHDIPSFHREKVLSVYKALEITAKVHFIYLRWRKGAQECKTAYMFFIFFVLSLCTYYWAFSQGMYIPLFLNLALLVKVMWADDVKEVRRLHILKCYTWG